MAAIADGVLSFGELDPLIFTGAEAPFEWPDLALAIEDGRGLIESDFGRVGLKLTGKGHLRDGFAGELAAAAPSMAAGGCTAERATLYGTIAIEDARPHFTGPLRFAQYPAPGPRWPMARCRWMRGRQAIWPASRANLPCAQARRCLRRTAPRRSAAMAGSVGAAATLTARYDLAAREVATPYASLAELTLEGRCERGG